MSKIETAREAVRVAEARISQTRADISRVQLELAGISPDCTDPDMLIRREALLAALENLRNALPRRNLPPGEWRPATQAELEQAQAKLERTRQERASLAREVGRIEAVASAWDGISVTETLNALRTLERACEVCGCPPLLSVREVRGARIRFQQAWAKIQALPRLREQLAEYGDDPDFLTEEEVIRRERAWHVREFHEREKQ